MMESKNSVINILTSCVFTFFVALPSFASTPKSISDSYGHLKQRAFSEESSLSEKWQSLQKMARKDARKFQKDVEIALKSKAWYMRNAALVALNATSLKSLSQKWSRKLLFDKSLVVRTQAIRNLIELKDDGYSEKIYEALNHRLNFRGTYSLWIRPYLAKALVMQPPKDWKKVYRTMLGDKDAQVQAWGVIGLEKQSGLRLGKKTDSLEAKAQKWLTFFENRQG